MINDIFKEIDHIECSRRQTLVRWNPTYICNYNCPGCFQLPLKKQRPLPNKETLHYIASRINFMLDQMNDEGRIRLYLEGGEVSLLDVANDIIPFFTSKNITFISLITNLSQPLEYYQRIQQAARKPLSLTASLHITEVSDPLEFINKADQLGASVNIVLDNQTYLRYEPYLQMLRDRKIKYTCILKRYTEPILEPVKQFRDRYICDYYTECEHTRRYKIYYTDGSQKELELPEIKYTSIARVLGDTDLECDCGKDISIDPDGIVSKPFKCSSCMDTLDLCNASDDAIITWLQKSKWVYCQKTPTCRALGCSYINFRKYGGAKHDVDTSM